MKVYRRIRRALEKQLEGTPGMPHIFWEGTSQQDLIGTPHVEPNFIPLTRRPVTTGPSPLELLRGLYQILVYTPIYEGVGDVEDLAETIMNRFPPSGILIDVENGDQIQVRIEYSEAGESFRDRGCIVIPVDIGWFCHKGRQQ